MKQLTACLIALMVAVALFGCIQGNKKISLRYKFEPGQKLTYEQVFKRSIQVIEGDSTVKDYSKEISAGIIQEITEIHEDGSATMIEIDTWEYEEPSKEDSTKMEKHEDERELTLHVQPNGRVIDIKFSEEESQRSIAYIKNFYEQGMPVFPDNEVTPGYSWTQAINVMLPDGAMEASSTYLVRSLVREGGYDCAVIECNGNLIIPIETDPEDSTMRTGVDHIQTTGKLYFAYKEGIVVLQRERWVIDGNRSIIEKGEIKESKVAIEIDTEFRLISREIQL